MPRLSLSETEIQSVRQRAIAAAKRLFAIGGFAAMSFRAIAAEIEFSKSGLYRYFSKGHDEILAAIRVAALDGLIARLWRVYEASTDPLDRLQLLGDAFFGFADEEPVDFQLLFIYAHGDWDSFGELAECIDRAWEPLERAFQDAIDAGLLEGNPKVLARAFYAAMLGAVTVYFSEEDDPLLAADRLCESLLGLLVRGATPAVRLASDDGNGRDRERRRSRSKTT